MSAPERGRPRAPAGLEKRGRAFWRKTVADFDLSDAEIQLLNEVCRVLDDLDRMHAVVVEDGPTVKGSQGQPVAHPALVEMRHTRGLLGRLLAQLELPDEDGLTLPTPMAAKARKAANTRWRPHNVAKEA